MNTNQSWNTNEYYCQVNFVEKAAVTVTNQESTEKGSEPIYFDFFELEDMLLGKPQLRFDS